MPHKDPEQRRAYERAHYAAHREQVRAYQRAYQAAHPEQGRAYRLGQKEAKRVSDKAYRDAHKEERKASRRAHLQTHGEAKHAYDRAYHKTHSRDRRAYARAYRKAHPDMAKANDHRRRARLKAAPRNDLTAAEWRGIKAHYCYRCVYCGAQPKRLTMDHVIPLVNGGEHSVCNVVPACHSCNSRKQDGPPMVPVQPLLLLPPEPHRPGGR